MPELTAKEYAQQNNITLSKVYRLHKDKIINAKNKCGRRKSPVDDVIKQKIINDFNDGIKIKFLIQKYNLSYYKIKIIIS